jgi:hypothetical protein
MGSGSEKMDLLEKWLKEICWDYEKYIKIATDGGEGTDKGYKYERHVYFYTDSNEYCIYAVDRSDEEGYLGCISNSRKIRAGESWRRGNDLPDGPFTYETWQKIKDGILRYELEPLSKDYKSLLDLPESKVVYKVDVDVVEDSPCDCSQSSCCEGGKCQG